ncbi:TrbI/VirB10 family protein [Helicobacter sp. MIT 03-1614]|uniref:Inner membrane protein of type IV secretion of T-DNA complex, TonB-like, VirB10 n=4 Tax=Helicobacter typhlonius TaxID=76936 RepID=A0A0S4PWE1_9HELI|nr:MULTISPECIES: TrbI/VirB10 family protein [Helicobacter]HCD73823.1 type IV secretion system protein VirB10 [Helicobacter sp.]TLD79250.1 TrbI/VirB10 family protein [Helicobacter typhlonius]TLD86935.1 TrbI/VirB10 family protein [Helicobacter sp. MIT 03-1614]TLD89420.1 TrbI/VirB10 family protein [Helicobacter sp. MIT 03-1616]CUU40603.1 Inner membrane protein of type IV secretion of T-DNA complex, TonB-like, VirB10 [Helicobacter typhlonius]
MENREANSNVLLESEGGSKRIIGVVAIVGGALFILLLILLSLSFGSDSGDKEKDENNKNALNMLNANNNDLGNEAEFGQDNGFMEVESSGKGLLNDLGLEQNSNDLVDSVKNNQTFEPQLTFNENFGNQSPKEEQPWWLTKDGFMKPRIIKGSSAGVISPRGGEAAKESNEQQKKQDKLNPAEMEQKTLQALNNMLDQTKNIDYNALMSANAEAQAAAGLSGMDFGSDTSYRQNTDFKGEVYQPTSAFYSPFNQSLLLPKNTYIPCSLQTKIVSELKGSIGCIVASDIYSANGQTLLIEKGSQISGSYTNADVTDGSSRLYVIWSEIRTPNNIVIPVDSGGVDALGGAGIEGNRDNHYATRFGAAILLSVIDGTIKSLGQYVNAQIAPNAQMYSPMQANQLANTALRQTINIKPTIYRNHGDLVGVYVNKDIDFSKVYQLRLRSKK